MTFAATARIVLAASAIAALAFNLVVASRAWSVFLYLPAIASVAAILAHRRWPGATRGAILVLAAVTPAYLRVWWGTFDLTDGGIWLAPLLATILADTGFRAWSLPRRWLLPLVLWGLCTALAWPIVLLREADFSVWTLFDYQTAVTGRGIPVPVAAAWVTRVAAAQMIGILWIDMLVARYGAARDRLERDIVWPIAGAIMASVPIAIYQAARDPAFLSPTLWGGTGRASGLLLDANVMGILAAMMVPAVFALTYRRGPVWRVAAMLAALACFAAVWGSGSRTALLAAACGIPLSLAAISTASRSTAARIGFVGAAIALSVAVGVVAWSGRLSGPVDRIRLMFERSWGKNQSLVQYLWDRHGYGTAAIRMIEEHPLTGIGVGSFHPIVLDYARHEGLSTDNAQNWLRHEVAERGVLGSLGVLVFAVMLAGAVVRPPPHGRRVEGWLIASALGGVAAASLMGVPAQHAYVLMVFWVFVAWHRSVSARAPDDFVAPASRSAWSAVFALAVLFAGLTVEAARDELRVSNRAVRFGWPYLRGFDRLETGDGAFRWTRQRAKAVIAAQPGYLKLTYFVHHADVTANPVRVTIVVEGRTVVDEDVRDQHARTIYVPVPPSLRSVTIETSVSRPWLPPHEGGLRELGLGLADWVFVYRPPEGAVIIQ